MEQMSAIFQQIVQYCVILLEFIGVIVLMYSAVRSIFSLFQKNPHAKLNLAEGIALALEYKLGAEVLRTLVVRTWDELAILGAVVLLRVAITFVIHREIRSEKTRLSVVQ